MKIRLLLFILLMVVAGYAGAIHLTVKKSTEMVSGWAKPILYDAEKETGMEISCSISTHVVAFLNGRMEGMAYDTTLKSGGVLDILINTPEPGQGVAHLMWEVAGTGSGVVRLYQPSSIVAGSALTCLNYYLNKPALGGITASLVESVSGLGIALPHGGIFGSGRKQGGKVPAGQGLMAGEGSKVLARIQSNDPNNLVWVKFWAHVIEEGSIF